MIGNDFGGTTVKIRLFIVIYPSISRYRELNPLPSRLGNTFDSGTSEIIGNKVVERLE